MRKCAEGCASCATPAGQCRAERCGCTAHAFPGECFLDGQVAAGGGGGGGGSFVSWSSGDGHTCRTVLGRAAWRHGGTCIALLGDQWMVRWQQVGFLCAMVKWRQALSA